MKFKVIGSMTIADAKPGETVDLDPDLVNVDALLTSGHIEEIKPASTRSAAKAKGGDE